MSRGLWFVAGAGAGVIAVRRLQKLAEAFTADGLRDRVHGAGAAARIFREEAAAGRQEKETELRERLALVPPGVSARHLETGLSGARAVSGALPRSDGGARTPQQKGSS